MNMRSTQYENHAGIMCLRTAALFFLILLVLSVFPGQADASVPCVWCKGRGEVSCSACGGSGEAYGSVRGSCYKCHGSGYVTCRYCGGIGTLGSQPHSWKTSDGSSVSGGSSSSGISLSQTSATLTAGRKLKLKVSGTSKKIKWSSSKKSVATVSSKGVVRAKKKGTATITAKVGGKKLKCKVKVTKKVYAKSVSLSGPSSVMLVGEKDLMVCKVSPSTNKITEKYSVSFSSGSPGVVSVDSDGYITAKSAGTAVITATLRSKGKKAKKASCEVKVENGPQRLLRQMKARGGIFVSGTTSFTYDASDNTYTFSTEYDGAVSSMKFSAGGTGTATISYQTTRSWYSGTYTASGYTKAAVSSISRNGSYSWTYTKNTFRVNINDMANTMAGVMLSSANAALAQNFSMTLKDLGFTSY